MPDPLQIRLSAPKTHFTAGEGVVLELAIRVDVDLEMETVELNRSRTRIVITPIASNQPAIQLTGQDHVIRFGIHPLAQVGIEFQASAGSEWTVPLELLKYTSPLVAGRYQVTVSYRYGSTPGETVVTNEAEIEIVAATVVSTRYRWFGHNLPYKSLCSIWTARVGDSIRWFYQEADSRHPAKTQFATEIYAASASATRVENPPRLGHLNDIAAMHFERFIVWTEPGAIAWLRIHAGGSLGEPQRVEHELTDAFLADPPLQTRAGGFAAVLVGKNDDGVSVATLFEVDAQGKRTERRISLPGPADVAVVLWNDNDGLDSIYFYGANETDVLRSGFVESDAQTLEAGGPIVGLAIDQWHGRGHALVLTREADFLEVTAWRTEDGNESRIEYDLAALRLPNLALVGWSVHPGARDLSLVMRASDSWTVLDQRRQFRVPFNTGNARLRGAPTIVSCPDGLFLVFHDPTSGFNSLRLGEGPPEPKI